MLPLRDMRLRLFGRPRSDGRAAFAKHPHVVLTLEDRFTLCGIYRPTFPDVNVTTLMEGDGPICPRCHVLPLTTDATRKRVWAAALQRGAIINLDERDVRPLLDQAKANLARSAA